MAALHSLLSVFAAIDRSVVNSPNPAWAAAVERYLPGTTGPDQRNWSNDIKWLARRLGATNPDGSPFDFEPMDIAFNNVNAAAIDMLDADQSSAPSTEAPILTTTDVAHSLYALATITKLIDEADALGVQLEGFEGGGINPRMDFPALLRLAGQPLPPLDPSLAPPEDDSADRIGALSDLLKSNLFTGAAAWPDVMTAALATVPTQNPVVTVGVATAPFVIALGSMMIKADDTAESTSSAAVTEVDGTFCVVLTTRSWRSVPNLTVNSIKGIVDPLNWAKLSPFFCQMDRLDPDPANGASQVLEHVSTDADLYQMKTALKYWKEDFGPDVNGQRAGIVNYELSDHRRDTLDSFLVLVDSGFIHISPARNSADTADGIAIRTSKMVAIDGASVTATAVFFGLLGWAAMGDSMLFDKALLPTEMANNRGLTEWSPSPEGGAQLNIAGPAAAGAPQDQPLPNLEFNSAALISEAAQNWAKYVEDASTTASGLVDKWYRGDLKIQDLVTASAEFGAKIASEPWRLLGSFGQNIPGPPAGGNNGQNEGGP